MLYLKVIFIIKEKITQIEKALDLYRFRAFIYLLLMQISLSLKTLQLSLNRLSISTMR